MTGESIVNPPENIEIIDTSEFNEELSAVFGQ